MRGIKTQRERAEVIVRMATDSADNLKSALAAGQKNDRERFAMHLVDAIVNIVEIGDECELSIMPKVFEKLKQLDRMDL